MVLYVSLLVSPATYVWMTILTFLHHKEKCCQLGWQMGGGTHLTDKPPQIGPNCALIRATCNAYYGQSRPSIWTFKRRLRNKQFQNQKLQITWRLKKLFGNHENLITTRKVANVGAEGTLVLKTLSASSCSYKSAAHMAQNLPLISPNKFKFNPDNLYTKSEQHGTEHCGKL